MSKKKNKQKKNPEHKNKYANEIGKLKDKNNNKKKRRSK